MLNSNKFASNAPGYGAALKTQDTFPVQLFY